MQKILIEPPTYNAKELILDIQFHPTTNLLGYCMINGTVQMIQYTEDDVIDVLTLKNHKKQSCRSIDFSFDGLSLISGSSDQSICLIDQTGKLVFKLNDAHENPIYKVKFLDNQTIASGDDEGYIKVFFYTRNSKQGAVYAAQEETETITDFLLPPTNNQYLFATSYQGMISCFDLRAKKEEDKLYDLSDSLNEDLYQIVGMKNGRFLVTGSSEGELYIYKQGELWGYFSNINARYSSMAKFDENLLIVGTQNGLLRGVSIFPNKLLKIFQKKDEEALPIEKLAISSCKGIAASISHDESNSIQFHELEEFQNKEIDYEKENQEIQHYQNAFEEKRNNMEEDEGDEEDDEDDQLEEEESKMEEENQAKKKNFQQKKKKNQESSNQKTNSNQKNFFSGL